MIAWAKKLFAGRWSPLVCALLAAGLMGLSDVVAPFGVRPVLVVLSISAVPLAGMFYWVRRRHRLSYGITEMLIAIAGLYVLMLGIVFKAEPEPYAGLIGARAITFMAAVYVMVRAFDNIGEGLTPNLNSVSGGIRFSRNKK